MKKNKTTVNKETAGGACEVKEGGGKGSGTWEEKGQTRGDNIGNR